MGNQHSIAPEPEPEQPACFICWETMDTNATQYVACGLCNVAMHDICSNKLLENQTFTKCPHCRSVGVLGVFSHNMHQIV
jgi:hypothetical protein